MTPASGSGAPLGRWPCVLAASVVLVIVLVWQRRQVAPPAGDAMPPTVAGPAAPSTDAQDDARAPADERGGTRTAPEDALGAIDPKAAWRAQAWRAVLPIVTERLGRAPTPDEQRRLLDVLASVGPAARTLDREMLDPDDPRSIARVREQTRVLVEADQTCRALLGIGVAELLRRLDPQRIEDQGGSEP